MSYLLYCIFRPRQGPTPGSLRGVDGQPVLLTEHGGLAAAISGSAPSRLTPDPSRLLAYARVIEVLHRSSPTGGVIPMRYGSLFAGESQVVFFLADRAREHAALLQDVEGCEEMGIRLILPAAPPRHGSAQRDSGAASHGDPPGKAYLAGRRALYAEEEEVAEALEFWAERCRRALAGLFVNSAAERRTVRDPQAPGPKALLSLYFLVPRSSVPQFRHRFQELPTTGPVQLLLSGPWPPYNFVLPKTAAAENASFFI